MFGEWTMLVALGLPLFGAVVIGLTGRVPNLREAVTLVTAVATAVVVWSLLPEVYAGERPALTLGVFVPEVALALRLEPLGMLFAALASFLWVVNSIYSIGYVRAQREKHQTRFFVCFAVAISAALGVACAGNLLTLFLFYEILTLSTYPLVAHKAGASPDGQHVMKSARVYLGTLLVTSIGLFLPAVVWTAAVAGTLDFRLGGILEGKIAGADVGLLLALFVFGIGKAAVMPVHRWLPAAMVAPTPVSALLHAVAVVKAGVFAVTKILIYVFGVDFLGGQPSAQWLPWLAAWTVIAGSVVALRQDDIKRMLAYSTISQLSYVVLAAAVLAPLSEIGAAIHVVAHAFGKITLFFAAGAIYVAAGKKKISQLDGIGRRMPWTMTAFTIAAFSMIGVPPTAGFVSKWFILAGSFESESLLAIVTIVGSTVLNAVYFLPIIHRAWLRPEQPDGGGSAPTHGEAPWPMVLALAVTALLTLSFFLFAGPVIGLEGQMVGRPVK